MTLKVDCSVVSSIKVDLTFDDQQNKSGIISTGDLVDVVYNKNGLRQRITGRVIKISVAGTDPNGWWIIVDGSDDFEATQARFTPMNIIDFDIIKKYDMENNITSPADPTGIAQLRVVDNGRLQYTRDGYHWYFINTGDPRNQIQPESGTVPLPPHGPGPIPPRPPKPPVPPVTSDDVIEDEES